MMGAPWGTRRSPGSSLLTLRRRDVPDSSSRARRLPDAFYLFSMALLPDESLQAPPSPQPPPPGPRPRWSDWFRIALPFAALAALLYVVAEGGYLNVDAEGAVALARGARNTPLLAVILAAVYAGLAALALPVAPLGYGAGALYGFAAGAALVWIASMVGAALGYFLAHGVMRGPAMRILGRYAPIIASLRKRHGFMTVLRIQLLPLIAFGPFNYAAGIAGIPFWQFMTGTAVGIVPGTVAIVYVGDRVMAGIRGDDGHPFLVAAVVSIALVLLSFVVPVLARRNRRGLAGEPKAGERNLQ